MKDSQEPERAPASLTKRIIVTLLAGTFIVLLIPRVVRALAERIDSRLGIPPIQPYATLPKVGLILAFAGGVFALWPIALQLLQAQGSPIPSLPTQSLLTKGPFRLSRNPMALGTIVLYFGLALWFNSWGALGIVLFPSGLLMLYIKLVEEPVLERRFGEAYRQFRRRTPFLIPIPHRGQLPGDVNGSYGGDADG